MHCHACNKDNLLYSGSLADGRYRYQCPTCHGAWAFQKQSFVPGEALPWVDPAPKRLLDEDRPVAETVSASAFLQQERPARRVVKRYVGS